MNERTTSALQSVFSNDYHCYFSSTGVQADTYSLDQVLYFQWRDISELIIEKGESIFYYHLCTSKIPSCMPFCVRYQVSEILFNLGNQ